MHNVILLVLRSSYQFALQTYKLFINYIINQGFIYANVLHDVQMFS